MIFVTDDHRTIRLARKSKESRGVIPKLDDSLMKSLMAETPNHLRSKVKVDVEFRTTGVVKKF